MKTPPYSAKAFLDMSFDIVDVFAIEFDNNRLGYRDRNGEHFWVDLDQTHWIKLGNGGRIITDGQVNKKQ